MRSYFEPETFGQFRRLLRQRELLERLIDREECLEAPNHQRVAASSTKLKRIELAMGLLTE